MSEFNLSGTIHLVEKANRLGIKLAFQEQQLIVNVPKGEQIDVAFLEELKNNKPHLIEYFKRHSIPQPASFGREIKAVTKETSGRIPLSFGQERIWVIDQVMGSLEYHSPALLKFKGDLNVAGLQYSMRQIVNRHPALRTVIRAEAGQPYQVILEEDQWQLKIRKDVLPFWDDTWLQGETERLAKERFDLAHDHMIRAELMRVGPDQYALIVVVHHIASDAWSMPIIISDLNELYTACAEERAPRLFPLPLQYADFSIWQRTILQDSLLKQQLDYWREQLRDAPTLNLPTDHMRPSSRSIQGASIGMVISGDLKEKLVTFSNKKRVSLYMTLISAFNVLLYRYSGQNDICIGSSIAGRLHQDIEGMVGFFANTLVIRNLIDSGLSFGHLLEQVKRTALDAFENQDVPFEKLVDSLVVERDLSRNPLFQVMFVMGNTGTGGGLDLGDVHVTEEELPSFTSKFDITLNVAELPSTLRFNLIYRSDLYNGYTMQRMLCHYENLLKDIVSGQHAERSIDQLGMFSPSELSYLQYENAAQVYYPREKTVVDLFLEQVSRTPDATAVESDDLSFSYAELDHRSNQLGHYLRQKGIGADKPVPVCMERGIGMIVAIMGIMKAGGAYVPIDPGFPKERIRYILEDTGANVVIGENGVLADLVRSDNMVIDLREDWIVISMASALPVLSGVAATNLACIIYTSGSTGKPKGVMIQHDHIVDYVFGLDAKTGIRSCQSFALVSTLATDLGNTVVYSSLLSGGCLHVFPRSVVNDANAFHEYFSSRSIDCIKIVPSHWNALSTEKPVLPARLLVFGGEILPEKLIAGLQLLKPACQIVNHYGPTETTIGKLLHIVEMDRSYDGTIVPIGKPFSNTRVYIFSPGMALCSAGIPGELYIQSDGVARGYLNRPDLDQERFFPDPFSDNGQRMYRTGDLVKLLPGGNIVYLGRVDNQVKINGYRVELEEIENVLRQVEGIKQAVVATIDDASVIKRLAAWVVCDGEFNKETILLQLRNWLPDHMMPSLLIPLNNLPLTLNGKIDKKALPLPDAAITARSAGDIPANAIEADLAKIWQRLLELDTIRVQDNFFRMGGNSLLAIRLVSAIRKELSFHLDIGDIFDHPTIRELAEKLSANSGKPAIASIRPALRPARIPLSFSQERLWFIDQLEGSIQYHVPSILRLKGAVDIGALEYAIRSIINRHEVLRTVIRNENGDAYQEVLAADAWKLRVSEKPERDLKTTIEHLIRAPFDLSADHNVRADLFHVEDSEYLLVFVLHHIASDAWSVPILIRELSELYAAHLAGRTPLLAPIPIQYADYSIWQRNVLTEDTLTEKLAYWQKKLEHLTPLDLPSDHARPAIVSNNGGIVDLRIDKDLTDRLRTLSREQDVTLFMTLVTVFKVLLYRYSGQGDITIGTPIAGRQTQEVEGLIGFFINTLVLRTSLEGNPRFLDLLRQVRQVTLEAYEHQEVPFEKIVESVAVERNRERSPLFDVKLAFNNIPNAGALNLGDAVELTLEQLPIVEAQLDLSLDITEYASGLRAGFTYRTDLYKHETISRMANHFVQLLHAATADPSCRVGTLPMLTAGEFGQLAIFRGPKATFDLHQSLVSWFAETAGQYAEDIALVHEGKEMSYRELEKRSNQLGHYLKARGVGKGTLVPVCIERGMEMIVSLLGILKAGGVYVPIDPEYPTDRIAYMLEDTGAHLVVTSGAGRQSLPAGSIGRRSPSADDNWLLIDLQEDRTAIEREAASMPGGAPSPEDLAYVIYTSGSTGQPKGVMVAHNSVVNLVNGQVAPLSLRRGQRVLQFASFGFDASCHEIFCTLLSGGRLVLCSKHRLLDPFLLSALMNEQQVELVTLPPSYQSQLAEDMPYLKTIISAGEPLNAQAAQSIIARGIRLINAYGPTEATVSAALTDQPFDRDGRVTIGKPNANVEIFIINKEMSLQPVGVPGELCIGGAGLALGYLNREELSAEKFVPNPFNKEAGARVYRTGDLARWTPDGNIEYLGRQDEQIKVRGYRIEPGEIEQVVLQSGLVDQAVVIAREDEYGDKRLVGYVVANPLRGVTTSDVTFDRTTLLNYLETRLPEYMVPGLWVELKEFPLTPNGKIDRKSLPAPDVAGHMEGVYAAPRTELEQTLASIWQKLLDVGQVGIHDDFFKLGGHSILAIRLVAAIRKELNIDFQIADIFDRPTIGQLSALLSAGASSGSMAEQSNRRSGLPAILKKERPSSIPLSYSQERLWFIDQLEGSVQYHIPTVVRLKGALDVEALSAAFRKIVERHEVLRTVILQEEGRPCQQVREAGQWQLNLESAEERTPAALQERIRALIEAPFDLMRDHMLRVSLIKVKANEYILVVVLHHIASDGWSLPILVNELKELYSAYRDNRSAELPALEIQYADYAIWQREYLRDAVLEKELHYWEQKLSDVTALLLPTDHVRPPIQSTRGDAIYFQVDRTLSDQLSELSQASGTTLFMTLLSAFKVLLSRYSGQTDICVGSVIANRGQHEIGGLIGFFVNALALRSDLGGNPTFSELLEQVRRTTLEAYEHQEVPFEKIVGAVVKERDMSRSPLFQVVFDLQHQELNGTTLEGVELQGEALEHHTSKFDLTFSLTEGDEGLQARVEYNTDLYEELTIIRMAGHYQQLLRSIAADPSCRISKLRMLPEAEERQLLEVFNGSSAGYPKDKTIVDLFIEQVKRTPNKIAVVAGSEKVTYRQLDKRSNQLASRLRELGVCSETLVPICIERGLDMIVGILGISKAGGAYVPIDPDYPAERIAYILEDTGASIVVSSKASRSRVPEKEGCRIVSPDEEWAEISKLPEERIWSEPKPTGIAYVIYTSGSTGRPKGVMVEHRNIVRLFETDVPLYDFTTKDVWTMFHSFCFDFSVWEMYGALFYGGRLVIVPAAIARDMTAFGELLVREGVTVLNQTPPAFYVLQDYLLSTNAAIKARYVIFGGEALDFSRLSGWMDRYPGCRMINMYGITETTVHVTYQEISKAAINSKSSIIGKAIPTLSIHILDNERQLLPIGVEGELHVGGAGLARGYLNREDLTTERFIPNPFSSEKGSRLYRTGDLGRWLPDGTIEYLGRKDDQVKIRGFRIELGEIEQQVRLSGLVNHCIVVARTDGSGNKRLIGYVVAGAIHGEASPDDTFDRVALLNYLQTRLPDYMIPAVWVELDALPLTSNGKVNRKGLPDPDVADQLEGQYAAPRTEVEGMLVSIWQELLDVNRIGINDNFFELGGDSIISIQVVSRAQRAGHVLRPRDLFMCQTIAALSALLAERSGEEAARGEEQGILTGSSGLLPIQQWFFSQEQGSVSHFNQSILLGIDKRVGFSLLQKVLQELVQTHDALRFRYHRDASGWHQEYGNEAFVVEREDLSQLTADELAAAIAERSEYYQASLDIFKGIIIRAVLFETPSSEAQHRLLIIVHHLAVDGVSWRILIDDLSSLFGAAPGKATGPSTPNGAPRRKTSSYRQWYDGLAAYARTNRLRAQQEYWTKVTSAYHPLPVDHIFHGPVLRTDMHVIIKSLPFHWTQQLLQEAPRAYRTEINDLLLAALARTLAEWSGQEQVTIGLEGHGRQEDVIGLGGAGRNGGATGLDISRTVGWFTTMYPVVLRPGDAAGNTAQHIASAPADYIRPVKEQLRQVPDKGLGYGVLKYINRLSTLQGPNPWDLVFNYLGQTDNVIRTTDGLRFAAEATGSPFAPDYRTAERLSVNSAVRGGELLFHWSYSSMHYEAETIGMLAAGYVKNLQELIQDCVRQAQLAPIPTPSDFGLAGKISIRELDAFLSAEWQGGRRGDVVEAIYPLSGLQEGMLFHGLYDKVSQAYAEQLSAELIDVQVPLLLRSWQQLIHRHTILRTGFYADQFPIPVQVVYKDALLTLVELDYRNLSSAERAIAITVFETQDRQQGFDFGTAPLMRLALIRLQDNRYRMVWTHHHIQLDGWSVQVLVGELLNIYESLASEGQVPMTATEDRYEDYIRYLGGRDQEQEEQHWQQYLSGMEGATLLPFINASEERNKGIGDYRQEMLILDEEVLRQVERYAQQNRLTVNTVMQGTWSCLLSRYTGKEAVTYGVTVSGRPEGLRDVESRVGMYINAIPLHTKVDDDAAIASWLSELQEGQLQSREYQYTALSAIQQRLGITGDLFDTLLIFENYPVNKMISSRRWSLQVENPQMKDHNNYLLSVTIGASTDIRIQFSYNSTLLDPVYVRQIKGHFEQVLRQIVSDRYTTLGGVQLLTPAEKTQLLLESSGSAETYAGKKNIPDLFSEQVGRTPNGTAVICGNERLTFAEMDVISNQLANYLRGKGIAIGTLVPVCIEQGIDMIVAILGILKAGGAYVPVDPAYPQDRIRYILEDTGAQLVVTSDYGRRSLPDNHCIIVNLTEDTATLERQTTVVPEGAPLSSDLAYVIYTSGSTGRPKGVMVEHGSLVHYIVNEQTQYVNGDGADADHGGSGTYLHLSYTFDASLTSIFQPLLRGRSVVIAPAAASAAELLTAEHLLAFAPYDFIKLTPAHLPLLEMVIRQSSNRLLTSRLVVGGEALLQRQLQYFIDAGIAMEVINEYGPTEATVGCSIYRLRTNDAAQVASIKNGRISIGRPIANTQLYILDKKGQLCPTGIPGELCIGGDGLARGYLNREDLTAEKFVQNPFSNEAGARLYRTGDLARRAPDGNIEYLGRQDEQVKVRGYRIEPGEIEQAVLQSGLVDQAVVIAREDERGDQRLVGYIVRNAIHGKAASGDAFDRTELVSYLQTRLPDYMIPAVWVELAALPLTPNGKVDRRGLPAPDVTGQTQSGYVGPRTEQERILASIWQELLDVEQVGINDNFFEMGGHSIMAIRLVAAMRKALNIEFSIAEVFDRPTIGQLSALLLAETSSGAMSDRPNRRSGVPAIRRRERPSQIPLSYSQERLWFIDQLEGSGQYHIPMVVRLKGAVDVEALAAAFRTIVGRHEVLRTVILQDEGRPYQQVVEADGWQLNIEDVVRIPDASVKEPSNEALREKINRLMDVPFDLSRDYKLRVNLIRLKKDEQILVMVLHHIASDGWSIPILTKELSELYNARIEGRSARLAALEIQYADYAIWQREYLRDAVLEKELRYWEKKLSRAAVLQLPTDHERPSIQSNRGSTIFFRIDPVLSVRLSQLSQASGTTLFMTLLSAFKVLLYRYSGQTDICVGSVIANRGQHETGGLIGFFVNALALRSDLGGNPTFSGLLEQVRRTTLEAYEHQEVPFEKIVGAVVKSRDMSRSPLFQVMFELQHREVNETDRTLLEGVEMQGETVGNYTSKFDLTYSLTEGDEGVQARVEYNTDLYEEATMIRMAGHYEQLLRSIVADPFCRIAALRLLPQQEEQELLEGFNGPAEPYAGNRTVVDLFAEQVAKTPDKIAVKAGAKELTYRELDECSNQLADFLLKDHFLASEEVVGMKLDRDEWALIAILGIFKAGGAYVPIDTNYPAARIAYIKQNSGCKVLLDESELAVFKAQRAEYSKSSPSNRPSPSGLAYILYTSGSTGEPKGAMIEHRGMLNHTLAFARITEQDGNSRIAQNALFTFDISVWQLLNALITGGTTVIYDYATILDAEVFVKSLTTDRITILEVVPSYLKSMLDVTGAGEGRRFPDLQCLLVTGEPVSRKLLERWFSQYPGIKVINVYGPTEASDDVTYHIMDKAPQADNVPIGRPIENMRVYILDRADQLCAIGVVGELYIGGIGVGRGYVNDPQRTEMSFVQDRFHPGSGNRLYRTGDLARWKPDGNIEFLGRRDGQVKIRGYRIELGEIENVLLRSGLVDEAVVMARENATGSKMLVAYVVTRDGLEKEKVVSYLGRHLPEHMVPAAWVELSELPLTPNGKVDRKGLPEPDVSPDASKYIAPRNPLEEKLAALWSDLLSVGRVGVADDFFELGGHSLLIIKIRSILRKEFSVNVPIKMFFQFRTIAELAEYIDVVRIPDAVVDGKDLDVFEI